MSCNCNSSPCAPAPLCDPNREPLASQLANFISTLFGSGNNSILRFECVNGKVAWIVDLSLAESPCFPIEAGEGYISYLGRIFGENVMAFMGEWSPTATYCKNFQVRYNDVLWIALQDVPVGTVPSEGAYWTEYLAAGTSGYDGWTPVLALVADGSRTVVQVIDWVGGEGTKPTAGLYVGPSGFVVDAADATNVKGADGTNGTNGTNGTDGIYPVSILSVSFTQPTSGSNVQITTNQTGWMVVGQPIFITVGGFYEVVSIDSPTLVTIKNLGASVNAAPGTTVTAGVGIAIGAFI